jgi:hypothetical protein
MGSDHLSDRNLGLDLAKSDIEPVYSNQTRYRQRIPSRLVII